MITSVTLQSKVTVTGTIAADGTLISSGDALEVASDPDASSAVWLDVGSEIEIEVAIPANRIADTNGVKFQLDCDGDGTDEVEEVEQADNTDATTVNFTYTVQLDEFTVAVTTAAGEA